MSLLRAAIERTVVKVGVVAIAAALLVFSAASVLVVYALQRVQGLLPLNPAGLSAVSPHLAFNTAVSFATNTNWQSYGGETTLSYLTQMAGLTVQNFVSAAIGMAVLAALARGFARRESRTIGHFWVDLTRGTLYVLVPLSLVLNRYEKSIWGDGVRLKEAEKALRVKFDFTISNDFKTAIAAQNQGVPLSKIARRNRIVKDVEDMVQATVKRLTVATEEATEKRRIM